LFGGAPRRPAAGRPRHGLVQHVAVVHSSHCAEVCPQCSLLNRKNRIFTLGGVEHYRAKEMSKAESKQFSIVFFFLSLNRSEVGYGCAACASFWTGSKQPRRCQSTRTAGL